MQMFAFITAIIRLCDVFRLARVPFRIAPAVTFAAAKINGVATTTATATGAGFFTRPGQAEINRRQYETSCGGHRENKLADQFAVEKRD
jgi:hypothetical protein